MELPALPELAMRQVLFVFKVEMSKILVASVPLSGHVNPAVALVKLLISRGHEVCWYSGKHYQNTIESSGAKFYPFIKARDFSDSTLAKEFPDLPYGSLFKHASYYIKHVFYDNMAGQYADLSEILKEFPADVVVTDEWFTGSIPLAEKKVIPWVCYCNSPLFYYTDEIPFPGAGLLPDSTHFGRNRNRIVNGMVTKIIFAGLQKYINRLRKQVGLLPMQHFFLINNVFIADFFIKFNTRAFEFKWKELPQSIRFVGPMLPAHSNVENFKWEALLTKGKPVIFITQGSVNNTDFEHLIIPSLKALKELDAIIIVATGSTTSELEKEFGSENVIIEKYIPYEYIMPYADIVITNGGFGGVITALWHGVPLIVAGETEDKPEIAIRITYCKAGIDLGTGHPKPNRIRKAVEKIMSDKVYKDNAMRISEDFKTHDAALETALLIEEILTTSEVI